MGWILKATITKESLNSDDQQFHSLDTKKTMTYHVENSGFGLGQAQTCGGVRPVNGISTLPTW